MFSLRNSNTGFWRSLSTAAEILCVAEGDVMINVEVKRSPARVSWWVVVNGAFLQAFDRKWEANSYADDLRKRYV